MGSNPAAPTKIPVHNRAMSPDAYSTEYECSFGKAGATLPRLFPPERLAALFPETAA